MEEDQDAENSECTQQQDTSMQLHPAAPGSTAGESGNGSGSSSLHDLLSAPPSPTLSMVTKHSNGTLNLWQLTFADKTKFSQVNMHFICNEQDSCKLSIKEVVTYFVIDYRY